jgi:putative (di)nucleoside polyphosphate hydrolase
LAGERINPPGAFQFPQGGIDKGEKEIDAARRELAEETGLKIIESPIFEFPEYLTYDFPEKIPKKLKKYKGQKQKWFLFFWDGSLDSLKTDTHNKEFSRLVWADIDEITANIIHFKKQVYEILRETAKKVISEYLKKNKNEDS